MSGLFDYESQLESINKHQPPLKKLDALIDWEIFRGILDKAFINPERKSNAGRKSYDKLLMFKIVMLQKYYNLSDEQTEFQIKDRLSFLDFLGLQIGDKVPDEKTIWLFKEDLANKGIAQELFDLFNDTLASNNILAKEGTIVDASFVRVPRQRNTREENAQIKQGEIPESFKDNPHRQAQKDCDARWTKKNNQSEDGYKNHIASDQKTKLITDYEVTPASTHDSQVIEKLIDETHKVCYADSAYHSEKIEQHLENLNVTSKVIKRKFRNKPLSKADHKDNYKHSKTRVRVEHIFGAMSTQMHKALTLTSIGMKRVSSSVGLINLLYNMLRYEQLVRLKGVKRI
jgi:IS5 family transposase